MNKSGKLVALKIAQILEEHSDSDIRDALQILDRHRNGSELIRFLAEVSHGRQSSIKSQPRNAEGRSNLATSSRAVLRLKEVDPDKYMILSEFDRMVRAGEILTTNESLRRLGEQVSKGFEPRKSRKESIGAVMEVIAEQPLTQIRHFIEIARTLESGKNDEYQRLAEFLIEGKRG